MLTFESFTIDITKRQNVSYIYIIYSVREIFKLGYGILQTVPIARLFKTRFKQGVFVRKDFKKWLFIAFKHLIRSARVLNNTEVKGHYGTICRHACFGVLRLISAAWYTPTYVAALYLYT